MVAFTNFSGNAVLGKFIMAYWHSCIGRKNGERVETPNYPSMLVKDSSELLFGKSKCIITNKRWFCRNVITLLFRT
jgi:hypothetical protein